MMPKKKYDKMLTILIERKEYERLLAAAERDHSKNMSDIVRFGIRKECERSEQYGK